MTWSFTNGPFATNFTGFVKANMWANRILAATRMLATEVDSCSALALKITRAVVTVSVS